MGSRKRVVICGGGAIGAAIAYFLSRRGAQPVVVGRHEVAGAASGKSGGFLALDWCRDSSLDRLARRSFELHAQLSSGLGDPWGYRRLTTYRGYATEDNTARGAGGRPWLADVVTRRPSPSSAPCQALTVASLRPVTVSEACSTRPRKARR
jgi:glycine/D-amino acid oxidase-like deaminating enzyme